MGLELREGAEGLRPDRGPAILLARHRHGEFLTLLGPSGSGRPRCCA